MPRAGGSHVLYSPKFFSTRRLFDLQLADYHFREIILFQLTLFLDHLDNNTAPNASRVGPLKNIENILFSDRHAAIAKLKAELSNLMNLLISVNHQTLAWIKLNENSWVIFVHRYVPDLTYLEPLENRIMSFIACQGSRGRAFGKNILL